MDRAPGPSIPRGASVVGIPMDLATFQGSRLNGPLYRLLR